MLAKTRQQIVPQEQSMIILWSMVQKYGRMALKYIETACWWRLCAWLRTLFGWDRRFTAGLCSLNSQLFFVFLFVTQFKPQTIFNYALYDNLQTHIQNNQQQQSAIPLNALTVQKSRSLSQFYGTSQTPALGETCNTVWRRPDQNRPTISENGLIIRSFEKGSIVKSLYT